VDYPGQALLFNCGCIYRQWQNNWWYGSQTDEHC
jgi:hypothetical protein